MKIKFENIHSNKTLTLEGGSRSLILSLRNNPAYPLLIFYERIRIIFGKDFKEV